LKLERDAPDPVSGLRSSDACWCRSGLLAGSCHGSREPASEPGAPITAADDETQIFVSPGRSVDRAWLADLIPGLPVYMPAAEPAPRPMIVPEIVARMTAPPAYTTPGLAELGQHRFTALDGLGLDTPGRLAERLGRLSDSDMADLRYFLIDTPAGSATCSRTGFLTARSSPTRYAGLRAAEPRWTRK
jgi:hypothetical protein